jgi:hypothetical protein
MINNTVQSSKSGGPLAAAWAVLQFVGESGYLSIARRLLAAKDTLVAGIRAVPGLDVMSEPEMSLVAFTSSSVSVFALCDELKARGWHVQPQLAHGPSKENIHMTINPGNTKWIADFVAELPKAVEAVRAAGGGPEAPKEMAALLAQQIESDPSGAGLKIVLESIVGSGGGVPGKMAEINALLNELPRKVQEKMLVAFVGQMFTPKAGG